MAEKLTAALGLIFECRHGVRLNLCNLEDSGGKAAYAKSPQDQGDLRALKNESEVWLFLSAEDEGNAS